jgi:hypothetical protein
VEVCGSGTDKCARDSPDGPYDWQLLTHAETIRRPNLEIGESTNFQAKHPDVTAITFHRKKMRDSGPATN